MEDCCDSEMLSRGSPDGSLSPVSWAGSGVDRKLPMNRIIESCIDLTRRFEQRVRFLDLIPQGGRVLDCGCGNLESSLKLLGRRPDLDWHGVDRCQPERVPEGVKFSRVNIEREPLPYSDGFFDGVYALHCVEHIQDLAFLGEEIGRVIKSGGNLFVEVPSVRTLFAPSSRVFFGKTGCFFDDPTHVRPFTKVSLSEFVGTGCGLRIISVGVVRNPMKILATPALVIYSLFRWRAYFMAGVGDAVGLRLYCVGMAR